MVRILQRQFDNILIIKPSSLGDVVRCLPILSGLRRRYPAARISWLIQPNYATVLKNVPDLDEIITFDRGRYGKIGRDWQVTRDFATFLHQLQQHRFDLVLDLQGLFRSSFVGFCSGAPVRLGFAHAREMGAIFYSHRINISPLPEHVVDSYWRFARALGFGHLDKKFCLPLDITAGQTAESLLGQSGLSSKQVYAVMLIGGTKSAKRWPSPRFARVAEVLDKQYDLPAVLLGAGPGEEAIAEEVVRNAQSKLVNLVGKTSLQELMALIRNARLVVGNDSGPLHIAAALSVPLVGLYGPTNPTVVGPYGQMDGVVQAGPNHSRRQRYSRQAEHQMNYITTKQVLETIHKKLLST